MQTWIVAGQVAPLVRGHSYVGTDKKKTFCVYAPSPEAISRTASRSKLPVTGVTEVRVLDPYFYK